MTRAEFTALFEKQLNGTITAAEEARLQQWFDKQQDNGLNDWDDDILGDRQMIRDEIITNIKIRNKSNVIRLPQWAKVAAMVTLVAGVTLILFKTNVLRPVNSTPQVTYQQINAPYGQVNKVTLPDSTTVWLNAGSHLRFSTTFGSDNKREVYLEGEAFFEVKHKATQPFIVHSGKLNTQVLGTSFNVKAYSDSKVFRVTVATGKVGLYTGKLKTLMLTPDRTGLFDIAENTLTAHPANAADAMAWREGKLIYRNELLSQALQDIGHKYGLKITLAPAMRKCRVYGTFNHSNVGTLLDMVAVSANAQVARNEKGYYVSGKACN